MPIHNTAVFNKFMLVRWPFTNKQWESVCSFANENNAKHYMFLSSPSLKLLDWEVIHNDEVSLTIDSYDTAPISTSWKPQEKRGKTFVKIHDNGSRMSMEQAGKRTSNWDTTDYIHQSIINNHCGDAIAEKFMSLKVEYVGKTEKSWFPSKNRLKGHHRANKLHKHLAAKNIDKKMWIMILAKPVLNARLNDGHHVAIDAPMRLNELDQENLNSTIAQTDYTSIIEASLIKLFKPKWNFTFKNTYPKLSHLSYKYFYRKNIASFGVELQLQGIPYRIINHDNIPRRMLGFTAKISEDDPSGIQLGYGPGNMTDEQLWSFMPDNYFGGSITTIFDSDA